MLKEGVLAALTKMLTVHEPPLVLILLEAIDSILSAEVPIIHDGDSDAASQFEALGGLKAVEHLQLHSNVKIYQAASLLADKHFHTNSLTALK